MRGQVTYKNAKEQLREKVCGRVKRGSDTGKGGLKQKVRTNGQVVRKG